MCSRVGDKPHWHTITHVRVASKQGQIQPKWDKFWTFSDHISVHFGSLSQNVLKYDQKKSRICPILGQSDRFAANLTHLHTIRCMYVTGLVVRGIPGYQPLFYVDIVSTPMISGLGQKWVRLISLSQNVLASDLKKSRIYPISSILTHFGPKSLPNTDI